MQAVGRFSRVNNQEKMLGRVLEESDHGFADGSGMCKLWLR